MKYYLAGFYLIQLRPQDEILTCSACVNVNLLDMFNSAWTSEGKKIKEAVFDYRIDLETRERILDWIYQKSREGKIGFNNIFNTLASATEYYQAFFSHLDNIKLLGMYLPASEADKLIENCKEEKGWNGIRDNLSKKELETSEGIAVGYDLIGVESSGSFHSFHCHHLANYLEKEFEIEVNTSGLLQTDSKWQKIMAYMNNSQSPVEPVPWYFAKVKLMHKERPYPAIFSL